MTTSFVLFNVIVLVLFFGRFAASAYFLRAKKIGYWRQAVIMGTSVAFGALAINATALVPADVFLWNVSAALFWTVIVLIESGNLLMHSLLLERRPRLAIQLLSLMAESFLVIIGVVFAVWLVGT